MFIMFLFMDLCCMRPLGRLVHFRMITNRSTEMGFELFQLRSVKTFRKLRSHAHSFNFQQFSLKKNIITKR